MPKIIVSSRLPGGHRRAGRFIPDGQTELDVTDEQLARIRADRQIVCFDVKAATPEQAPSDPRPPGEDAKPNPSGPKPKK